MNPGPLRTLSKDGMPVEVRVLVAPLASRGNPDERVTRLELVLFVISHNEDHYGEIVAYLRMSGTIPQTSRPPAE
jgi:uncharacterized damage-inducible protein DinB